MQFSIWQLCYVSSGSRVGERLVVIHNVVLSYAGSGYYICSSFLTVPFSVWQGGLLQTLFCIGWHPYGLELED